MIPVKIDIDVDWMTRVLEARSAFIRVLVVVPVGAGPGSRVRVRLLGCRSVHAQCANTIAE